MSTLPRRARFVIALAVLCGALAAAAAPEPPGKVLPAPLEVNVPLAREQLKLIDQILGDMEKLYRHGELGAAAPGFSLWSRRRVDALRASGATKAEIIAALGQHLDRTKSRETAVNAQYKDSQVDRTAVFAAQYERLEAEMLLNQEKAQ